MLNAEAPFFIDSKSLCEDLTCNIESAPASPHWCLGHLLNKIAEVYALDRPNHCTQTLLIVVPQERIIDEGLILRR